MAGAEVLAFPGKSATEVLEERRRQGLHRGGCKCTLEPSGRISALACSVHFADLVPVRAWRLEVSPEGDA